MQHHLMDEPPLPGDAGSTALSRQPGMQPQMQQWLGVIGGMGPAATADFLQQLVLAGQHAGASCDQEHLPVLVFGDCTTPDRTAALMHGGASPAQQLTAAVKYLSAQGVGAIAIACNTAHVWLESLRSVTAVPLLSVVESVRSLLQARGSRIVGLLGTPALHHANLYGRELARSGITVLEPTAAQILRVNAAIAAVKAGRSSEARRPLLEASDALLQRGAEAVLLACTEIPLVLREAMQQRPLLDCTYVLASACVQHLRAPSSATLRGAGPEAAARRLLAYR